jgi:hypothetical protein
MKNGDLHICVRDDQSTKGYPTSFEAPTGSQADLLILTRKK